MTQNDLIEQFIDNLDYNFTSESKLILISEILDNLTNEIRYNQETKKDKKSFKALNDCLIKINNIIIKDL